MNCTVVENIIKVCINFYTSDEILTAKKWLWTIRSDNLEAFIDRKKNTDKISSSDVNVHDIITYGFLNNKQEKLVLLYI